MKLRIYDWRFRDGRLEALYVEDPEPAGVALREEFSPEARRARELEARGYYSGPRSFGKRYRFCYLAANAGEVDPEPVRAVRPDIVREEPLWAEAVRRGWELYRDVERVSLETGVPLQAVIAILENLRESGVNLPQRTDRAISDPRHPSLSLVRRSARRRILG